MRGLLCFLFLRGLVYVGLGLVCVFGGLVYCPRCVVYFGPGFVYLFPGGLVYVGLGLVTCSGGLVYFVLGLVYFPEGLVDYLEVLSIDADVLSILG